MPLPPAPKQRASLLSLSAVENSKKTPVSSTPLAAPHSDSQPQRQLSSKSRTRIRESEAPVATEQLSIISTSTEASRKKTKRKSAGPRKLFVLDTNVLMHDPMSLFRFEEHDVFLPMIVLEELDGHKRA